MKRLMRVICLAFFLSALTGISTEKPLFAIEIAMEKDVERFLNLRSRSLGPLKPAEKEKVAFAIAEYYFATKDYIDAKMAFEGFFSGKRSGITTLLANVFLYKLSKLAQQEEQAAEFKKKLFQDQFILLFNEYKTLNYISANNNNYEIRYFVDKIEIYLNGDVFEQVSP